MVLLKEVKEVKSTVRGKLFQTLTIRCLEVYYIRRPSELKIRTPVLHTLSNRERSHQIGFFYALFVFELEARTRQTDRRTDGRAKPVMRTVGTPG